MSTIQEITSEEDWRAHVASLSKKTLLVISFHAPWAAPCTQMNAVLKALAAEYPVSNENPTSWVSLNAEELSDISETYDVTAVPFLVLQRDDQILETVSGSSAVKVRAAIEAHAKPSSSTSATQQSTTSSSNQAAAAAAAANGSSAQTPQVDAPAAEADPAKAKEELWKKLGELVKAAPVMLFMKGTPSSPQCGFSRQLVALLRERSVKYGFFNILADDEVRQGLKEFADWPTYPQLWMDGDLVGGLDIIKEELETDPDFFKAHSVAKEETTAA
ncbi:monothiol glutaredoxin-5 [Microdochium trichocladiopsis]|uniref:Monothiol glutaredoxin-5 n=1 Tax=Microdochium trichocladiopsis TaxID=1682393 RepID=A0A9P8YIN9_9PEZI|nr:monothiol glutaredoxin-5 [Microdochium trichocladiopsis]KAH7039729.1 monothiol glutaredoxin-5 [Microdochium trichocladiopsis]